MRALSLLLVLLLCLSCGPGVDGQAGDGHARVVRVIDGDTIEIEDGARVRYIGIDTPEVYPYTEFYGEEALQKNRELVEGKAVRLEADVTDKDQYGRLLRYVYVDGLFVNAELVRLGYARAFPYPPDTSHQELLSRLEDGARDAGIGLWQR
jgi:micrococcal nuclease